MELLYISLYIGLGLIILTYNLIRAMGLFEYADDEKRKEYEVWLKEEGPSRKRMITFGIIVLMFLEFYAIRLFAFG